VVPQSLDVGDRLTAGGEDGGHVDQHVPAVVDRYEPAPLQRHRQPCRQTHLGGEQTHRRTPANGTTLVPSAVTDSPATSQ
jgi:hypothetical protein